MSEAPIDPEDELLIEGENAEEDDEDTGQPSPLEEREQRQQGEQQHQLLPAP